MSKIKKKYSFTNNRQIWRLIPTDSNKMIIEDRDTNSKEVFFNCLEINNGEIIFKNFQLTDKFWVGIETVYKDIIFFHKFLKPGLPIHTGIIAFDISSKKIIWSIDNYNFLFIKDDKIYVYKSKFEGREFLALDYTTGDKLEDLGNDSPNINSLREDELNKKNFERYLFPKTIDSSSSFPFIDVVKELKTEKVVTGNIEYIDLNDLLLFNFHEVLNNGNLRNIFRIVKIESKKVILEEILDRETKFFVPESFFIKNELVFIIKEKTKLSVYSF